MQETTLIEQDQPVGAILSPVPAPAPTMTLCSYGTKLTREELARVATPAATATHKPIPHIAVVEKLIEALGFRQIGVVREEYAVSSDGMRMFGVMDLSSGFDGCRFAVGLRNSHDKSFRLSCTVGLRVFVCENLAFHGEYATETVLPNRPVRSGKHSLQRSIKTRDSRHRQHLLGRLLELQLFQHGRHREKADVGKGAAVPRAIARAHPIPANLCGQHDQGLDVRELCVPQKAGKRFLLT